MSQQINLYNPLFRKKGFSFTSSTAMLYGMGIAVVVGAAGAAYERHQLRQVSATAQAVDQTHKDMVARFDNLTAALTQQKPNAQLETELAKLDTQLKGRQEIIETLNGGAVGNTGGFSEYMRAFSRQSINGIWLTGFDIAYGGNELAIQGRTLNADLVATYLKQLNQEKPLQGRQFAALRISQPPADPLPSEAEPKADATAKDAKELRQAAPRFLEFSISTTDLPDNPKPSGPGGAGQPLLGAIDPNALPGIRKTPVTPGAAR